MNGMRAFFAGALAALAVVASGCGSSSTGTAHGASLGGDAAKLVPANALAFASIDSDLDSSQWQRADTLARSFTNGMSIVDAINSKLQSKGLSWQKDVAPAVGPEVDVAVLGAKPKPDVVAFAHPSDQAKLAALVAKIDEHYSVEQIGGWSVVADSPALFAAVRSVRSGQSLADDASFRTAWSSLDTHSLAQVFVNPSAAPGKPQRPDWISADVRADADANAVRIDAFVKPQGTPAPLSGPSLIGDVPSGAALAVAFHGSADLATKLSSLRASKRFPKLPLKQLAPLIAGGGVVYARPNGLVPDLAVELAPKDPQAALATAKSLLRGLGPRLGPLRLTAQVSNGRLVIADSPAAAAALHGGAKLVDDSAYKDALASAGAPGQTSLIAYADVAQLAPFVPVALQAVTGKAPDPRLATTLAHVGSVVAWATQAGGLVEVHAWIETR
jgi:hypothetical protein